MGERATWPLFVKWARVPDARSHMRGSSYSYLKKVRGRTCYIRHEVYEVVSSDDEEES